MSASLKLGMVVFYALVTLLTVQQFSVTRDRSFQVVSQWVLLYLSSVVWPVWWTLAIIGQLRKRGVPLDDRLQFSLFMPAWFAAITAQIALQLAQG